MIEFTNDEFLSINYNKYEDTIQVKTIKKNKILEVLKKNKFLVSVLSIGLSFVLINVFLVYNFFKILASL